MERWQRLYVYGMGWAIFLFILGELIWLPDPIRIGDWFWIDEIDVIVYLILLIPLLWIAGAVWGLRKSQRGDRAWAGSGYQVRQQQWTRQVREGGFRWIVLLRGALIAASGLAGLVIALQPKLVQVSAPLLGTAWILACVDITVAERERERAGKLPRRGLAVFLASAAALASLFWPTPYLVTYPGLTVNMNRYALAEGGITQGEIMGVLVFERPAFPVDWLYARLFPHYSFERIEKLGMSLGEYSSMVREMKADANALGSAVAFGQLGIGKGAASNGAKILAVVKGSPAEGTLAAGDTIVGLNGQRVASAQNLTGLLRAIRPGDEVTVELQREGSAQSVKVKTKARDDDPRLAAFGIEAGDDIVLDLPLKVSFRQYLAHEGGPSHGAALALTLMNQLTPGGITYGHVVACTGTINPDGSIGRIGGIEQKAFTVERAGGEVFFVPAGQEREAQKGSGNNLRIVPVKTLQDILDWLKAHPKSDANRGVKLAI